MNATIIACLVILVVLAVGVVTVLRNRRARNTPR